MDRNVVTATILITVILAVWLIWLSPTTPRPADTAARQEADSAAIEAGPPDATDAVAAAATPATDTSLAAATTGEDRLITVVTDLYTAQFSTRGATIQRFSLNEYERFDRKTNVEIVDTTVHGALGLVFTTPASHVVDTRSYYFTTPLQSDTLVVKGAAATLQFEAQLGAGTLRQTYTFTPDKYEVGLRVDQVNPAAYATRDGYELVWNGGIPWTENDPEDEARHSGAYAMSGGEVEYIDLNKKKSDVQRLSGEVSWVSVKNKYFAAVMIPGRLTRGAEIEGTATKNPAGKTHESFVTRLNMDQTAATDSFKLFLGPLEYYRITGYDIGLYDMVDYGYDFFEWLTRPLAKFIFIPLFTLLYKLISNWGLVLIAFSILMKLLLYPLTQSSFKSMAKMREMQPKMEAIKEKYAGDPQKQQEATMRLYKEAGVNPLGGCLPMLAQWPVLIALYQFIPQSIELRQASFLWAQDLSAPDIILRLPFSIPMYGDFVAGFTLLMGLSMILQMRLGGSPEMNAQNKVLQWMMPIMLFLIFNRFASGLSLYYLVFNIASAVQQFFVNRQVKAKAALAPAAAAVRTKTPAKAATQRSKKNKS